MPVVNHRTRCSDEPCVQVSESTPLPERCWMWSSPTAAAASSAVWTSSRVGSTRKGVPVSGSAVVAA